MMSSKMIVVALCIVAMAINFAVFGNKITFYDHVLNYVNAGLMLSYITFNSWKFGEIYIKGVEFELFFVSSMICIDKVRYYNDGKDLDFSHYGKIITFLMYWCYKIDERNIDAFLAKIKSFF